MNTSDKAKAIYKVTDTHVHGFFNEHRFLSNFHLHSIEYEEIMYPSNENAYQAAKSLDSEERLKFAALDPSKSKSTGRSIPLRADWLQKLPNNQIVFDTAG